MNVETLLDDGDDAQKSAAANRRQALGALLGYVNGLMVPFLASLLSGNAVPMRGSVAVGIAVMAASDAPAVALGVTDSKTWGVSGWVSDILPHLIYGAPPDLRVGHGSDVLSDSETQLTI